MSRFRRAVHGVASGYLFLAATALYVLGSVPIALHYLDRERFGLWALLGSLLGYLSMVDLGMSSAISRQLIDVKDDRSGNSYGAVIKTGWLILGAQGVILAGIGFAGAGTFCRWMGIPQHLDSAFQIMVWLQCGVVAFGLGTRMFQSLLVAHHRMDIANYGGILGLGVNFAALWFFFAVGADVYSLIFAGFVSSVAGAVFQFIWCCRLGILPERSKWGSASASIFRELFSYGREVFLVTLGAQLILASQTIIIARMIGLEAAAVWSIATRTFTLVAQAVWRLSNTSLSVLSEMLVRGERERLRERYSTLARIAISLSVYCALCFALCNSAFVSVWTSGKVSWSPLNDVLLSLWLIALTWGNTNANFLLAAKEIRFMKYVLFAEGLIFVASAALSIDVFGIAGMLVCSVICSLLISGAYSALRISSLLGFPCREVFFGWTKDGARLLVGFAPAAALCWWATQDLSMRSKLIAGVVASGLIGVPLFLRLGVPKPLKQEFAARTPRRFAPIVERVLGCSRMA